MGMAMNMQSKQEQQEQRKASPRALRYFPRFVLAILAVLLLLFLGWSLTGGGSVSQKQGIQTPPAMGDADQPNTEPAVENEQPKTGTGGDQPSNPPPDQK